MKKYVKGIYALQVNVVLKVIILSGLSADDKKELYLTHSIAYTRNFNSRIINTCISFRQPQS